MKQLEFEMDSKEILPDIIEYKWSKKTKIFLGLLISFTILLILILVLLLIGAKKVKDDRDDYEKERNILKHEKYGSNWPVVYILNNKDEAYVGETTDISIRSNQHWANEVRRKLDIINVIGDETFNKSSILDLESFLIKYMSADNRFKLQNYFRYD